MQYPHDFTDALKKKPICGVLSVAIIGNVSFARATQVIKNNMMPFQKRHGGKTYNEQRENALRELGVNFRKFMVVPKPTLRAAVYRYCTPGKTYMVMTSRHVVTVRNHEVADQDAICHIDEHPARRCFVHHILEIL